MNGAIVELSTRAWNLIRAMNSGKLVSEADKAELAAIRRSCPVHTSADFDRSKESNGICGFCGGGG